MRNYYVLVIDAPADPQKIDEELHEVLDALLDTPVFQRSHLQALDVIRPKDTEEIAEYLRAYYKTIEAHL